MSQPIVTVLEGEIPVFGLDRVADHAELRIVDQSRLREAMVGADVLFLWDFFADAVNGIYDVADELKWIHVAAAGVDKLLVPKLVESDILVTNAHGIFDQPIAEYVLACVASFFKELPISWRLQAERSWVTRQTRNLAATSVLVVGAGGIGRATARLLTAVGMKATLVGRSERSDPEFGTILCSDDLALVVGDFDVVVAVVPLTAQTTGLISSNVISEMKPGCFFVNVGRGRTVDQWALTQALGDGRLGGAAIDTFEVEPLPHDDRLWSMPNVFVSPHMSSRTDGWLSILSDQFCSNFDAWRSGDSMPNVIDKRHGFVR